MNTKCPRCGRISNDIFTNCPYCLFDTTGEAICISCNKRINQLEYWNNGNTCPYCNRNINKTVIVKKEKKLFTYYEDFSKHKNENWKEKYSLFYGKSELSNQKFTIKNKLGWSWINWILFDGLDLNNPFVIKSEIELTAIGNSSIFGLLIGNKKDYYKYIFNKDGKFNIERCIEGNNINRYKSSSIIKDFKEWSDIPNFNLIDRHTLLLEVFYNKKHEALNFYVNGMKIAFCVEHQLPDDRAAIGFITGKQKMEISILNLFVRNYDINYKPF